MPPYPRKLQHPTVALAVLSAVCVLCGLRSVAAQSAHGFPVGLSQVSESEVSQLVNRSKALAAQSRFAEAEEPLLEAEKLAPADLEILTLLGKIEGLIKKYPQAIAIFRKTTRIAPTVSANHVNLAIALADAGELSEALTETSTALALTPTLPSAHLNRARILADLHRTAEARSEFASACRLAPDNPDGYYYWALLERESENLAKETELLQRLVELQPGNDKAFFFLGRSLSEQRRDRDAVAALRKALLINPDSSETLYLLSRKLRNSDPEEAKRLLERFQAVRKNDEKLVAVKALGNEAYAASTRQDWPQAIRLLREALESCGSCEIAAGLHRNLGLALCKSGKTLEGESELRVALQLNPNDPDAVKALAIIRK